MADHIFGVVVLNWNNSHETIPCLKSLYESHPRPDQVVVVDNGSSDKSVRNIEDWQRIAQVLSGWLTIVQSSTNKGFAGGNNLGIRYLRDSTNCSHILLLNN